MIGVRGSVLTVFRCVGRWVHVRLRSGVFVSVVMGVGREYSSKVADSYMVASVP